MEDYNSAKRKYRWDETKNNAVAFLMLGLALFALYSNMFLIALIPLIWMGYRVGKETGRHEAHQELAQASMLSPLITFPQVGDVNKRPVAIDRRLTPRFAVPKNGGRMTAPAQPPTPIRAAPVPSTAPARE